jgi:hypothetical protein
MLHRTLPPLLLLLFAPGVAPACADVIRITEVVTDPQSDHNESAGGNGVAFDDVPGSGSITSSDEWVELANVGSETFDLTGFSLSFLDSTPSTYVFGTTTTGTLLFSGTASLTSFAPGDFLLLGNPPGALNNKIDLEFRDPYGTLIDDWSIADANASGRSDESLSRPISSDVVVQGAITPLIDSPAPTGPVGDTQPVPEPSTLALLGLSVAGWIGARRRRARRASCRTRFGTPQPANDLVSVHRADPECRDHLGAVADNA